MTMHENPVEGMWCCSPDEERWPWGPFFDTPAEAKFVFLVENDDEVFYVGKISLVVTPELAAKAMLRDARDADERMAEENDLSAEDAIIELDRDQEVHLKQLVAAKLREWGAVRPWVQVSDCERVSRDFFAKEAADGK